MKFDNLAGYMDAFAENRELAIVPIPLVAEYLGKSAPAVTAMIKSKRLNEIQIGKNRFVDLKSLINMEQAYEDQVSVVKRYLIQRAKKGERVIFYEPVMTLVGMSTKVPADRTKIGQILGDISESTYKEHGVLLSVLVHRKTAGITSPGPGFFELAADLGLEWHGNVEFIAAQTDKVLNIFQDQ